MAFAENRINIYLAVLLVLTAAALVLYSPAAEAQDAESGSGSDQEQWYDPRDWFDTGDDTEGEDEWYDFTFGYSGPREFFEKNRVLGYYQGDAEAYDEEEFPDVRSRGRPPEEMGEGKREFGVGESPYDYYTKQWTEQDGEGDWERWYEE